MVYAGGSEMIEEVQEEKREDEEEDKVTKKAAKKPESVPSGKGKGKKGSTNARWATSTAISKFCNFCSAILQH